MPQSDGEAHSAWQSLSSRCSVPAGQHPSPLFFAVIGVFEHSAVHCALFPFTLSIVHGSPSSHEAGQRCVELFGSHVSFPVTTPSPHFVGQSLSVSAFAPEGQHMSPGTALVMRVFTQVAVH